VDALANIALVHRFYAAGPADDDSSRAVFAVPDVVWHVPGASPVSGRYEGYDEVFATIGARMQPLDVWTVEVREVMGNDDMIVAIVDLVAVRGPHRVESRGGHAFRFAPDGRIAEVWGFVAEQSRLDALFSS
jgi:ketosteroid isomerase-like protein